MTGNGASSYFPEPMLMPCRRAYDRMLQQEQAHNGGYQGSAYRPNAPQSRGPRATYAWETTHRSRQGHDMHGHPQHPRRRASEWTPPPPPKPPRRTMGRTRWGEVRGEEAQEMERVRGVSGAKRALQLVGLVGLSFAIFGGWRQI
ncbi:hypothetical protein AX15_000284 [Amanita polypyramis BW_CC]|nr:hypothetical protein AX15_000284 [Amanita polypyramis BW_CC]